MAESIGDIQLDLGVNQSSFNRQVSSISGMAAKAGAMIAAAFAVTKIVSFTKSCIEMGSAINEVQNVVDVTFGALAGQVNQFAKDAIESFGLSELSAKKYTSTMGAMLKSMGLNVSSAAQMSEAITGLSGDIASFYNLNPEEAFNKIRAGISGETEPLKQLGINMSVANLEAYALAQGINKTYQAMSQQEQVMLRYNYLLNVTKDAQGDFARTSDGWANQVRVLSERFNSLKSTLGQGFINIFIPIIGMVNTLVAKLQTLANYFKAFTEVLTGKKADQSPGIKSSIAGTDALTNSQNNLAAATKKAGKEAKGSLAGFDEVNQLQTSESDSDSSDGGGLDAGGVGGIQTPEIPVIDTSNIDAFTEKVQGAVDKFKSLINDFVNFFNSNKEIIIAIVGGIVGAFALISLAGLIAELPLLGAAILGLLSPMVLIGAGIAALIGSFIYLYRNNEDFRNAIQWVWSDISKTMNDFIDNTLKPIFKYIVYDFLAPIGKAFVTYILPILAELFVGIGNILNDILKLLQSTFDNIWGIVKPGLDLVKTIIIDVLEIIKKLWDKYGSDLLQNIRDFIKGVQETFQLIWDNIINPIVKPALEMLTWLWNEHLKGLVEQIGEFIMKLVNGALEIYNGFIKPLVDFLVITLGPTFSAVIGFIINLFGTFIATIADIVKALLKILGGIVDFIVGVLTGNWKKAWQGLVDVFKGIVELISGIFKGVLNVTIDVINAAIKGVLGAINGLIQGAMSLINKVPGINIQLNPIQAPQIPKLAKGGIIDQPTLAMVGEAGKEAVVPLENTAFADSIGSAVANAVVVALQLNKSGDNNDSKNTEPIIQLDGVTLGRIIYKYITEEGNRIGNSMLITT